MSSFRYQELIDEYKDQLPDILYKKLCDLNQEENKKEENTEDFYEIKYVEPNHFYNDDMENNIQTVVKTKIMKLEQRWYNAIVKHINADGWCHEQVCIRNPNNVYETKKILKINYKQVYDIGSCSCDEATKFFSYYAHPKIISIKKA